MPSWKVFHTSWLLNNFPEYEGFFFYIRTMKFTSKFASYLLGKCFIANTCLELCIIWENLDRDSWRLRTLSYISTNPWEFLFYSFFNQYKIKSWRKIKFLVNEGKKLPSETISWTFLSYLFVPTWEPICCKRHATMRQPKKIIFYT